MQYIGNIDAEAGGSQQVHIASAAECRVETRTAMLILSSMDVQHSRELNALEESDAEEDLKEFIKSDMVARHHARRAPFVKFLEERTQQGGTFAA